MQDKIKKVFFLILFLSIAKISNAQPVGGIKTWLEEADGTPSIIVYKTIVDNGTLTDNADGTGRFAITAGSGDVTAVGDCLTGACFDGTSGNTFTLKGATSGTIALKPAAVAGTNTITFPAETGTVATTGSIASGYAPLASPTFTGTVTIPTPFTLGAVSVLPTGTEFNYVDGVTSAIQTQIDSKQGTLTNSAGLAAALSDETGSGLAVFATSPAITLGANSTIPNGATPTVDAAGEIAQDTTDDQLLYGATPRVLVYEWTRCMVIENLAAADDNYPAGMFNDPVTITGIGVHCDGTCTTAADIDLSDRAGNAMTHGAPTVSVTTGNTTFTAVTAANSLVAGEGLEFSVANAVSPETDKYLICITGVWDRQ